ncbi:50S ribosomal protein L15 [Alphaproteobacteria bacterium]|nr:50S ribosomal protein L15 [Alphaproteobacteria bacterium]
MKYNELNAGANRNKKRVGRGISAGGGKTAGRGTKGQKARTGKKLRATFAGGQREMVKAVPKLRGFKSLRVPAQVVYGDQLDQVKGAKIDNIALYETGLITTPYHSVKVIARGETKSKATVETQGMSKSVIEQLIKNGGQFVKTDVPTLPASKKKDDK